MNQICENLKSAYDALAAEVLEFAGPAGWSSAGVVTVIFSRMTQTSYWREEHGLVYENDRFPSLQVASAGSTAALAIRDYILASDGVRVWGLSFTLAPDGKFRIEFNYDRPEGYEQLDEEVDLLQGVEQLNQMGAKIDPA